MSDILVIGGGVIGLLTARELAEAGAGVTLVEMGETGREASWAGGGIISPLYPWRYADSVTALSLWGQRAYPDLCARLREETGIDPEHIRTGLLILDQEEHEQALTWAETHGVPIEVVDGDSLRNAEPALGPQPERALLLPEVAQVRNPRLTKALRRSIEKRVQIREQEEVIEILVEKDRTVGVRTQRGTAAADKVVICTGAWTAKLLEQLGRTPDILPVRGQIIMFYAKPDLVNHVVLYRDRYVIPRKDGRILIGSTLEDTGFVKATTAEAKEDLYRTAVEIVPLLKRTPIEDHWAGLRPGSPSGIPYIGAYPGIGGLYVNAGHFRNGLVTGPASARLVTNLLLDRAPFTDPAPYALDASR
ncbi:MAG: glycine oxidase ThiO [Pseudomonadota bacterium]|nr:glycine oxidase ThiO [Pseudomonadota bacterium]